MRRRSLLAATGAVVALAIVGCTFDQKTIGVPPAQVAVHSVLDPSLCEQPVLVERTLTGAITVEKERFYDPRDPLRSSGGVPISGAQVTITAQDGRVLTGIEVADTPGASGAGFYLVSEPDCRTPVIRPGRRYSLRVVTPDGTVVTGATTTPRGEQFESVRNSFDRDRDTLRFSWRATSGARAHGVWIESPYGAFVSFSDSSAFSLAGDVRNPFAPKFRRLFIPGFEQGVAFFSADTNYFDYYRSRSDPFTGSGLINHLNGGIGLFGSIYTVHVRVLSVMQGPREPALEGLYDLVEGPRLVAEALQLYVETPGEPAALSGWYGRYRTSDRGGIDGTRSNGTIVLNLLAGEQANNTIITFTGTQVGDSVVGSYAGLPGRVVFQKRRGQ
jgi:hypothetical protein